VTELKEYTQVKVVKLLRSPEHYDGWGFNTRLPRIGDVGTIVDILTAPNYPNKYTVESVQNDGVTVWLSDFQAEELGAVEMSFEKKETS
jgi:hypothetical protein